MKIFFSKISLGLLLFLLVAIPEGIAQEEAYEDLKFPITISLFSESVSLPNFRGFFRNPNWGLRVGTELYYRQNDNRQLVQTINIGYYRHDGFQQGLYLSSEFGYRRFFGDFMADATLGVGYLHLISGLKRYEPAGDGAYQPASQHLHKFMPTLGIGLGYRFNGTTIFSRYEIFGEFPFSYKGAPLLPHKALHVGARFQPFR